MALNIKAVQVAIEETSVLDDSRFAEFAAKKVEEELGILYTITKEDVYDVVIVSNQYDELSTGATFHGADRTVEGLRKQVLNYIKLATQCEAVAQHLESVENEELTKEAKRLFGIAHPEWSWRGQTKIIQDSFYRLARHNLYGES